MLMLTRSEVEHLLDAEDYIDLIEDAFAAYAAGETLPSVLAHLDSPPGEFHIKASGAGDAVGVKIGACFYDRPQMLGLPSITGLIALFDSGNGEPLLLLESATVTRLRTAAATAVAARHLALPEAATLAVCGLGGQAAAHIAAVSAVRPIRRVLVWGRDAGRTREFAAEHGAEAATCPGAAAREADIVVTLTPAEKPYLGREDVRPGALVAAVGSDAPHKRELRDDLLAASALVTDVTHQCAEAGELHHRPETPVRAELGQVVSGGAPGRLSDTEIVVFDSTGTAVQDVAAARALYTAATRSGLGRTVPLWD
ncbi:ornithine cyclodeaminase/alanine dehydrogenase-like protein (mu-crystallin family) [Thermocatellispora tengchongensis]|uniref:Ornithine cyclodeaminase/alanine dehydrogenase-like protein (Mu-crystallin family) n=1 Tax=Thermocatellispora tengchongensis TaxID=1073253 RepID=A0A840PMH9_9ACTN|nr:ornithine cyclodeaminase family protein [Thermocatellispora tengchongensis]MBB5138870.1 ornithine cyclodeaminase/alanine dehydrogenase-like protein (mu-crystallin family) [Thermocatellispora tengchongensis]